MRVTKSMCGVCVFASSLHASVCPLHSQVFAPYVFFANDAASVCVRARVCVGVPVLADTSLVLGALSQRHLLVCGTHVLHGA